MMLLENMYAGTFMKGNRPVALPISRCYLGLPAPEHVTRKNFLLVRPDSLIVILPMFPRVDVFQ